MQRSKSFTVLMIGLALPTLVAAIVVLHFYFFSIGF
jgi:hypothetical protein